MKVVHIATIDVGGAYKAASRLHEALLLQGVQSNILLRTKTHKESIGEECFSNTFSASISKAKNVCNMLLADRTIARDVLGTDVSRHRLVREADIIVLHWINSFLTCKELKRLASLGKPILWFMHDMWIFTGGCHVDGYCGRYEQGCGFCPMVKRSSEHDVSYYNFQDKMQLLKDMDETIVAGPSQWIVQCAQKSAILQDKRIIYLPNLIDMKVFKPANNREILYRKYGIHSDKKIVLFGAADSGTDNKNKGFQYLLQALELLPRDEYQLLVFGNSGNDIKLPEGFEATFLGFISEESRLAEVYNLADVFVNPSNQESFGYTTCEAMACATPVVAFPIGGLKEQIIHKENGYLAEYHNSTDLAEGIRYCAAKSKEIGIKASNSAFKYSYTEGIRKYLELMRVMIEG